MDTISYRGQTYTVESTGNEKAPYILRGPRGAEYGMLRHYSNQDFYFLVNCKSRRMQALPGGFKMVNGQLRETI